MADKSVFSRIGTPGEGGGRRGGGGRGRGRGARGSPYDWRDRPRQWKDRKQGEGVGGLPAGKDEAQNHRKSLEGPGGGGGEPSHPHMAGRDLGGELSGEQPRRGPKKFTNKARLFVGNLPRDFTEEELKKLFEPHGEVQEVFLHKEKNFGFVRMAFRGDAEKAIAANHGLEVKNRDIKVRFAASSCSVKVTNLHPLVSNELLEEAFSQFGEVENAVVVTDERGKSLCYGIVDFARKAHAIAAIHRCKNEPFLLTRTPIPVLVRELVRDNEDEGHPEKSIPKSSQYMYEREYPPRFAQPGSLEYEAASRWRVYFELEESEKVAMEEKLKAAKAQLEQEMVQIKDQHQAVLLRQEIMRHQQEQMRLAEKLRQQEERLQLAQNTMASSSLFGPPAPLFPGQTESDTTVLQASLQAGLQGGLQGSDRRDKTSFPGLGTSSGLGAGSGDQFPSSQAQQGQFIPPPLMGQR